MMTILAKKLFAIAEHGNEKVFLSIYLPIINALAASALPSKNNASDDLTLPENP
jgi:hypothetical protein